MEVPTFAMKGYVRSIRQNVFLRTVTVNAYDADFELMQRREAMSKFQMDMKKKGEDIYGVDLEQYSEVHSLARQ
jgi:hypothetical protein